MSERENILGRVREALRATAPRPGSHGPSVGTPGHRPDAASRDFAPVLPGIGRTLADNLALFAKNAAELKADFVLLDSMPELVAHLGRLRDAEGWRKVASHHGELTDVACGAVGLEVCFTDGGYNAAEMEKCDAGISQCDALVAHTGSVLVTSRSAGGRALSVLPPHHVVVARREQMVGGLPEAFALLKRKYADSYPSMISFITGPSRTGDIERILVLGAHGPKKLTILCV